MKKFISMVLATGIMTGLCSFSVYADTGNGEVIYENYFDSSEQTLTEFAAGTATTTCEEGVLKSTVSSKGQNVILDFGQSVHKLASGDRTSIEFKLKMPQMDTNANYAFRFDDTDSKTTSAIVTFCEDSTLKKPAIISFKNNNSAIKYSDKPSQFESQPSWEKTEWVNMFMDLNGDKYTLYANGQKVNKAPATINNKSDSEISDIRKMLLVQSVRASQTFYIDDIVVQRNVPMTFEGSNIEDGSENISVSERKIGIEFNTFIDSETLNGVTVTGAEEDEYSVKVDPGNAKRLLVEFVSDLKLGTDYKIDYTNIGNVYNQTTTGSLSFTTEAVIPPQFDKSIPKDGSDNVSCFLPIMLKYTKDLENKTGEVTSNGATFVYSTNGKKLYFTPKTQLSPGKTYTVETPAGLCDYEEQLLPTQSVTFTTTNDPIYVADIPGEKGINWINDGLSQYVVAITDKTGKMVTPDELIYVEGTSADNDTAFHYVTGGFSLGSKVNEIETGNIVYMLPQGIDTVKIEAVTKGESSNTSADIKFYAASDEITDPTDMSAYTEVTDNVSIEYTAQESGKTWPAVYTYTPDNRMKYFVVSLVANRQGTEGSYTPNYVPQIKSVEFNTPMPLVVNSAGIKEGTALVSGTVTPFVTLTKNSDDAKAAIAAAYYKNGLLQELRIKTVSAEDFTQSTQEFTLDTLNVDDITADCAVKIFTFDSLSILKPLKSATRVTEEGVILE